MKDLTADEWQFIHWIEKEIKKADKNEKSLLHKQLSYLKSDPMFSQPDENGAPFSPADALTLGIIETVYDQGVEKTIVIFAITIPNDTEYLKALLLKLPFHYCKYLIDYARLN